MDFSLFFVLPILLKLATIYATETRALYRHIGRDFSVGDFSRISHYYLWANKLTSAAVTDGLECSFLCLGKPNCFSFNMAKYPDSNGTHLCELLPIDKYRATDKLYANSSFHHYSPRSPCARTPCKNNGECIPNYHLNTYSCDCKPGFSGRDCQCAEKSCSAIMMRNGPTSTSGSYLVDPDGKEGVTPFTVYCDMRDKNGVGVTVISHDSENRTLVDGYESRGSYSRDVNYTGASLSQLASLTEHSAHCEQFIKYECSGSLIAFHYADPYAWWVSRDGAKMTYWGGASYGDRKCACGLNNTCANPNYGCNCDKNTLDWHEDSGLLTNKSHLPVMQLRFGDTGTYRGDEMGYHTLGKLKCYGMTEE